MYLYCSEVNINDSIILFQQYHNPFDRPIAQLNQPTTYGPRSDERDLMAIKVKSGFFPRKKDQAKVNNY